MIQREEGGVAVALLHKVRTTRRVESFVFAPCSEQHLTTVTFSDTVSRQP